jgi:hypothetical protein
MSAIRPASRSRWDRSIFLARGLGVPRTPFRTYEDGSLLAVERAEGRAAGVARGHVLDTNRLGQLISKHALNGLRHADDGQRLAVAQRDFDWFDDVIATEFVKRNAGQSRTHFKTSETGGSGGVFAILE